MRDCDHCDDVLADPVVERERESLKEDSALLRGLNCVDGKITYRGVAEAFGMEYHEPGKFLG